MLNTVRPLAAVVAIDLAVHVAAVFAGQAPAPLRFEVASVKRDTSPTSNMSINGGPGQYRVANAPLRWLIRYAYRVMDVELVGGPGWISDERFDVVAKLSARTGPQQVPEMMQALLVDRFKLAVHAETRELPMYELQFARADRQLGPALQQTDVDCAAVAAAVQAGRTVPGLPPQQPGRAPRCGMLGGPGVISVSGVTMKQLGETLAQGVGRPVTDGTGLRGTYDADLHFSPNDVAAASADVPSLFTALQEQLGLELQASKGPVRVLVIDRVDHLVAE